MRKSRLHKILTMALVLIMLFGVTTPVASADGNDAQELDYIANPAETIAAAENAQGITGHGSAIQVSSWSDLRTAVDSAPANVLTVIEISESFGSQNGDAITIPADRNITLVSSNTSDGEANVRALTQTHSDQRHFIVNGSLTLCQNITLSGGGYDLSTC